MTLSLASSLARLSLSTAARSSPRHVLISSASSSFASSSRASICAPSSSRSASIRLASTASPAASAGSSRYTIGNLKPAQPKKTIKRLGRGSGSGRGGTATRGHKGQKARRGNGKPTPGFEGGQTPLMRRYPKRGFTNIHGKDFAPLNVDRLQAWIDRGLLDPSQPITARELLESRCVHGVKDGIKLLGDGAKHLRTPVNLVVSRASASAIDAVEKAGGSIETRYYTDTTLRALIKPHKFEGKVLPLPADPTTKRDLVYYANARNRGYLAKQAALGQLDLSPRSKEDKTA